MTDDQFVTDCFADVTRITLVLDEGIVRDGYDIDLAVIHALGFRHFGNSCARVIPLVQLLSAEIQLPWSTNDSTGKASCSC